MIMAATTSALTSTPPPVATSAPSRCANAYPSFLHWHLSLQPQPYVCVRACLRVFGCIRITATAYASCCTQGQPNWCASSMPCDGQPLQLCAVRQWCVCQWAFAAYVDRAGGCVLLDGKRSLLGLTFRAAGAVTYRLSCATPRICWLCVRTRFKQLRVLLKRSARARVWLRGAKYLKRSRSCRGSSNTSGYAMFDGPYFIVMSLPLCNQ